MLSKRLCHLLLAALVPALLAADPPWIVRSQTGMVAADSPEASQVGAEILEQGGNAFDAAIATSFALAVARPESTGLGGGGFMLAYLAKERRFVALDFREMAPAAATRARYEKLTTGAGDGPPPSIYGGNAVGIPGQLAGLVEIQRRFATKPLAELVEPAIRLAETGFTVDEHLQRACREALADYTNWPQLKERHAQLYESLLGSGEPAKPGDKLKRPDLAKALTLIAEQGPDVFYRGPIAAAIVRAVRIAGGEMMMIDLEGYRVREREPLRATYGGYEIVTMPPPSSGGVCLLETLNILSLVRERIQYPPGWRGSGYPRNLIQALKHAFADRARWLGDPDFASLPVQRLTSRAYAEELLARNAVTPDDFGSTQLPDDRGTSHFCVADKDGNVVALTETINGVFGSLVIAEPYGIPLNNQMDDFTTSAGKPNLFGLIQGEANAVGPAKRPLSSMTPTIVLKDNRPALVLGASGGPRIITSVLQVLLNVIEFDMSMEEAMTAVRLHHQWKPDEVYFDREPPAELAEWLKNAKPACKISTQRKTGVVQAIQFLDDGTFVGASDPRRGGRPAAPAR
jgi:gamma-glutamyltranspeptidase/glutathione hydrolase